MRGMFRDGLQSRSYVFVKDDFYDVAAQGLRVWRCGFLKQQRSAEECIYSSPSLPCVYILEVLF